VIQLQLFFERTVVVTILCIFAGGRGFGQYIPFERCTSMHALCGLLLEADNHQVMTLNFSHLGTYCIVKRVRLFSLRCSC